MQQYYRGEYDQSTRSDKRAKTWAIVSIVTGAIIAVAVITLSLVILGVIYGITFSGYKE